MKKIILQYCDSCGLWNGVSQSCRACKAITSPKEVPAKRGGLYYLDGVDRPLHSVTAIMQVIAKPAIGYWLKKVVAEAVFANPMISLEEALAAPDRIRDKAGAKGSDIHKIVEAHAKGQEIHLEDYSDPWKNHVEAYLTFCSGMPHEVVATEQVVHSAKEGFAGTLDSILKIDGEKILVDFKTSKALYPKEHAIQLGAYYLACQEMGLKIDKCAVIHLKSDSTYTYMELKPEPGIFLAALRIYNYNLT